MKKLTKVITGLALGVVLSAPIIANAKVNGQGVYWHSNISLTRSTIYARAESGSNMYRVDSKAVFSNPSSTLAFDTGRYWSEINVARPETRYGNVGNVSYYETMNVFEIDYDTRPF